MNLQDEVTGKLVGARVVAPDDEVTCISANGLVLRTSVNNISRQGRYSRGVRVMDLEDGDAIASVAVIREGRFSQADGEERQSMQMADEVDEPDLDVEAVAE
jgi:DNA gyrase subunit A